MAVKKVLARGWKLEIDDTGFKEVKGLTSLTFANAKEDADITDFDSDGQQEHIPVQRGHSLSMEGFYLEDPANGDRDPGQEAVETLGAETGYDGIGTFKMTSPGGTEKSFEASAVVNSTGGGLNDPTGWSVELKVTGAIT